MGYYIETPALTGKADYIARAYSGEIIDRAPASYADIPAGKALVVVVVNTLFEAAGVVYSEREFDAFTDQAHDFRPRTYVLMDRALAFQVGGRPGSPALNTL